MTETRIIVVGDVIASAERILSAPYEACHVSIDERIALAVYALHADRVIRELGLSYPPAPPDLAEAS